MSDKVLHHPLGPASGWAAPVMWGQQFEAPAPKLPPIDVRIVVDELSKRGGGDAFADPDGEQKDDEVAGIPTTWLDYFGKHGQRHATASTQETAHEDDQELDLVSDPCFGDETTPTHTMPDDHHQLTLRTRGSLTSRTARRS